MKRLISCVLIGILCICRIAGGCLAAPELPARSERAIAGLKGLLEVPARGTLLDQEELLPAGQSTADWIALALALQHAPENYAGYLERLSAYVTSCYATEERLDRIRATEWHRIGLTVLALGGDPTAFGTAPDGTPVDLVADGVCQYAGNALDAQGLNGLLYALILLDAKAYETPADSRYTRDGIQKAILEQQNEDGGFGLAPGNSDADITAMALQALAPHQNGDAAEAVRAALAYLSGLQEPDGGFAAGGIGTLESTAQVVLALCALGMDPDATPEFCKNGVSVLEAMLSYQLDDGSFAHIRGMEGNPVATEQGLLALTAVERYNAGQNPIFDFTAYTAPESVSTGTSSAAIWIVAGAGLILCVLAVGAAVRRTRRTRL